MARFKCKNCGHTFNYNVKDSWALGNVRCPECQSSWVECLGPDYDWSLPRNIDRFPKYMCSWEGRNAHLSGDGL